MTDTDSRDAVVEAFQELDRANPHPVYHRLREVAPQLWQPETNSWIFTRYADAEQVLRDPRWSSNPSHLSQLPAAGQASMRESMAGDGPSILLFLDPPDHTRIRNLVSRCFTPKAIQVWQETIRTTVSDLLDEAAEKDTVELIHEFCYVVPVVVICEILGVPAADRDLFGPWSSHASRLLDGDLDPKTMNEGLMGAMALINYLNPLIEERHTHPRDDLLSDLVHAETEDGRLSEEELRAMVILLFVAGHETTMNLIGNGTYALLNNPDQLQRLIDDPSLIETAVEEILRYDGPVHVTGRIPTEDIEVAGQVFEKGCQVITLLAACNRDPDAFPDPDKLDIGRTPNHHLTFSKGLHHCLGASLARLEGQIALGELVRRFPNMELASDNIGYREHFVLRGLESLPLKLNA